MINKKVVIPFFAGLVGVVSVACGSVPEPGETVLKVYKAGDNAGFEKAEIVTGNYGNDLNVVYYKINNKIVNYVYTNSMTEGRAADESIKFRTSDGFVMSSNIGISYIIVDPKKFLSVQKMEDESLTLGPLYILLRDKVNSIGNTYSLNDLIAIPGQTNKLNNTSKTLADFQANVLKQLNEETAKYGVKVLSVTFVNGFTPPKEIAEQVLNSQMQLIETQKQTSLSQTKATQYESELRAANAKLQLAKIEAETRKLDSVGVTNEYVTLQVIALLKEKWNGSFVIIDGK
jgi:hypothetical protein